MAYTFAPMPTPESSTAEQIVNAITSIQTAVNDLDSRVAALNTTVTAYESRIAALESQDTTTAADITAIRDEQGLMRADIDALQSGGVPNAITSPDGSVQYLEIGTKATNDTRTGLPATHVLMDRG